MLRVSSETVKTFDVCWKKSAVSCIRAVNYSWRSQRGRAFCLFSFCRCDLRGSILDTLLGPRMIAPLMQGKRGLQLDRVVLLGRTFEEYRRYFLLKRDDLIGKKVLDVAGG